MKKNRPGEWIPLFGPIFCEICGSGVVEGGRVHLDKNIVAHTLMG